MTTDPERRVEFLYRARTRQNRLAGLLPQTVGLEVPLRIPERLFQFLQRPVSGAAFLCDGSKARAPQPER